MPRLEPVTIATFSLSSTHDLLGFAAPRDGGGSVPFPRYDRAVRPDEGEPDAHVARRRPGPPGYAQYG
jgi:hypothetical protein